MGFGFADYGYAVQSTSGVKVVDYTDGTAASPAGYMANSAGAFTYANLTNAVQYQWRSTMEKNADGTPFASSTHTYNGNQMDSTAKYYNQSLIHPLNYISNGAPTLLEKDYIGFVQSAAATAAFTQTNTWGMSALL
jgi:hypothetical protein